MKTGRRWLVLGLAGAASTQALAGYAQASEPADHPEGPVSDAADILPPDIEASLDQRLRAYFDKSGTAVVVASVKSLEGRPIEQTSLELAQEWNIGSAKTLRGLLVLVAPNEREVRIEVSCGLESVITDAAAERVIRDDMVPKFKQGELSQGTIAGVDALLQRLNAAPTPIPASEACMAQMKAAA